MLNHNTETFHGPSALDIWHMTCGPPVAWVLLLQRCPEVCSLRVRHVGPSGLEVSGTSSQLCAPYKVGLMTCQLAACAHTSKLPDILHDM